MEYLKKSFTVAMSSRPRLSDEDRAQMAQNALRRNLPHEFLNGGVACLICCLAEEAQIHRVTRDATREEFRAAADRVFAEHVDLNERLASELSHLRKR